MNVNTVTVLRNRVIFCIFSHDYKGRPPGQAAFSTAPVPPEGALIIVITRWQNYIYKNHAVAIR